MRRAFIIRCALVVALVAAFAAVTAAQIQPPKEFETLKPGSGQESLPAAPLVYGAYAAVWVVLLGYVYVLWRRASRLELQITALQSRLKR